MEDTFASITDGQPFLILAPHPDDELLGAAGLMLLAKTNGVNFGVVILTDGSRSHPEAVPEALAKIRKQEAHAGLANLLGQVPTITFADFQDGDLGSWLADAAVPTVIEAACKNAGAVTVIVTDPADNHPDHKSAFGIAAKMVAQGLCRRLVTVPVGQRIDGKRSQTSFLSLALNDKQQQLKKSALMAHASQFGKVAEFKSGFHISEEALTPLIHEERYRVVSTVCKSKEAIPARHFDTLFAKSDDPWGYHSEPYEKDRFRRTVRLLEDRRYANALEIGCANGALASQLSPICGHLLAIDHSKEAIARARAATQNLNNISLRCLSVPNELPQEQFDLILFSDMLYYLGFDGVVRLLRGLPELAAPPCRLLVANYLGETETALTGEMAAEMVVALTPDWSLVAQDRTELLRLDLFEYQK